ncbi:hypothetical protein FCM35_KLT17034 [Carex littledalei]|uniref:Uncharacterized protein n=1 Tax=Carex littledalei TaxID=544730 RepID=A0A833RFP8_9POAL|nr:hypothetical protein FCM35_KLT17034 [Carex littledalei]
MPTVESVNQLEKAKACVEFALRKLEDVWNVEAALLSGATSLSEASVVMESVKSMLRKIQVVLLEAAPTPALCWKDDDDDDDQQGVGAGVMKWITAVVDVCICIETVVTNFSNEVVRIIPISSLPIAVQRISSKPVDLFALNRLAIEMKKIQSQLDNVTNNDPLMHLTIHNHADATLQAFWQRAPPSPLLNVDEMELVGYEALQKSIIDKLLDPTIPQCLQVAILGPEAAGKTTLAQKIYQRSVPCSLYGTTN